MLLAIEAVTYKQRRSSFSGSQSGERPEVVAIGFVVRGKQVPERLGMAVVWTDRHRSDNVLVLNQILKLD